MKWVLGFLLVLSLVVRSLFLTVSPPELFGDEVDVGYQAFSLFRTGRDLYGQLLPTYIHSLSEWRAPLLMYVTVPSIALFGNTVWGVRLPEVILGSLGPIILFLLVFQTTRSKFISFLTSLSLSLAPWHILYSRAAFEAVLLLDLILLGALLFIKKRYLLSVIFFALTFYTYSTALIFTPILIIILFLFYKPKLSFFHYSLITFLLIPIGFQLFFGKAAERYSKVGFVSNPQIVDSVINARSLSNSPIERLFSNRPAFILRRITTNYLSAFSVEFLFLHGDVTARHSLQYIGQLFPFWAPFMLLGVVNLFVRKRWFWLTWLFISPIPSALTYEGAIHATRLFMMLPPLILALASGLKWLLDLTTKKIKIWIFIVFWIITVFQFADAANYYFYSYPRVTWRWWHYGYNQAFTALKKYDNQYSRVFINSTNEPTLIRFLFYYLYPPAKFQKEFILDQPQIDLATAYYGFFIPPKYFFGDFSLPPNKSIPDVLLSDSLYLISQRQNVPGDWNWAKNPPGGVKVLETVYDPTGSPLFYLITKAM